MVYVDDFKMSGPADKVRAMWGKFGELDEDTKISLGPPEELGQFLGCLHEPLTKQVAGRTIRGIRYNMEKIFTPMS